MLKKAFNTLTTKVFAAAMSLCTVMLTTHFLGPEGRGEISLISADIAVVLLFAQVVGGPSLVYLYSRYNPFHLFLSSFIWIIIAPFLLLPTMQFFGLVEHAYGGHLIVICLLLGLFSSNQILLLGAEKIKWYNLLNLLQVSLIFLSLCLMFFCIDEQNTFSYILALYSAYGITLLLSFFGIHRLLTNYSLKGFGKSAKEAIIKGATVQFSNLVQFLNYRLSFFFLSSQKAHLGIFSVSLVLAEAVWLIGNSISLVQYSSISNETSRETSIRTTFIFAKFCFWATLSCVLILALSPEFVYEFVFGEKFGIAKRSTLALCPGILFIGFGMIFSHYFAGIGRFKINNIATLLGLAIKIPACIFLIPEYEEVGAAMACSLSYFTTFLFLFYKFRNETGFGFKNLLFSGEELDVMMGLVKRTFYIPYTFIKKEKKKNQ